MSLIARECTHTPPSWRLSPIFLGHLFGLVSTTELLLEFVLFLEWAYHSLESHVEEFLCGVYIWFSMATWGLGNCMYGLVVWALEFIHCQYHCNEELEFDKTSFHLVPSALQNDQCVIQWLLLWMNLHLLSTSCWWGYIEQTIRPWIWASKIMNSFTVCVDVNIVSEWL